MTLIAADMASCTMLSDDAVGSGELQYRSFCKVFPWHDGFIGMAGHGGFISAVGAKCEEYTSLHALSDLLVEAVGTGEEGGVEALVMLPDGLWLLDSYGCVMPLEEHYSAVGSGAPAAIGIMRYTHGNFNLITMAQSVADITPSVSDRFRLYQLGE